MDQPIAKKLTDLLGSAVGNMHSACATSANQGEIRVRRQDIVGADDKQRPIDGSCAAPIVAGVRENNRVESVADGGLGDGDGACTANQTAEGDQVPGIGVCAGG